MGQLVSTACLSLNHFKIDDFRCLQGSLLLCMNKSISLLFMLTKFLSLNKETKVSN